MVYQMMLRTSPYLCSREGDIVCEYSMWDEDDIEDLAVPAW
jgi:hypothetical protein